MPPVYDIYGLSKQREKKNIERFLNHFSCKERIESLEGQEILVYKNEKYRTPEVCIPISTLTEVIDFGLENPNLGFAFYLPGNPKEGINRIILKFTFDGKIIFGVSVEENVIADNGKLVDNYGKALEIEKLIAILTNSSKTSIQFEYAPSDDEEEFDSDIELWKSMNNEKQNQVSAMNTLSKGVGYNKKWWQFWK